ncbi:hypothetical protein [Nocardia asiatica]|uniref:hypothetical protein n=1 Tax=Nocardia asiatica TaxID=209252 RepID=UPI002458CB8B|nr:hypothetical protein [Nocardia asiatica]
MSDVTPDLMLGLTRAERDAADRLELTVGVDLLLQHTHAGWVASLLTPNGDQQTAAGTEIGPFLLSAADRWANPLLLGDD